MRPSPRIAPGFVLFVVLAMAFSLAGCGGEPGKQMDPKSIPDEIQAIMDGPRYQNSKWSLLVRDVETGELFYELNPNEMSLTGSTRKLFSIGLALDTLGADHRIQTPVFRTGDVDESGVLDGNLVLVGSGDLTFGGRRVDANTVQYTNFDHNDANSLGTAILTPQDPLYALDDLAKQISAAGIKSVSGDVVVDDRLFTPYRVPNGNLLITPMLVNENMVDLSVTPAAEGEPATLDYRPRTGAFGIDGQITTTAAGTETDIQLGDGSLVECIGQPDCTGSVSGTIADDYEAPFDTGDTFVGTFRIEDPASYARIAFIEALQRHNVEVTAPAIATNPADLLTGEQGTKVASYESAPYSQQAQLVLKVSLNLGANLGLSLFGLTEGAKTIEEALAAERKTLETKYGVPGTEFDFPTNGSGTPDSRATPNALVEFLIRMAKSPVAGPYQECLPVLGENGSLATSGVDLPGRGHVFAKPGTTIMAGDDGQLQLRAQNLAGYIETKSGRTVAYALMLNNGGPVTDIAKDVGAVFEDEAKISSLIYELL